MTDAVYILPAEAEWVVDLSEASNFPQFSGEKEKQKTYRYICPP